MINNSFFQKVGVGMLVCKNDSYSTIIEANDAFYNIIGYTAEEMSRLYKDRFSELVIDDLDEILRKVGESVQKRNILDYEFRVRHKSGHIVWIHDVATYDEEEDVFNVVIMDITYKAKALELALYEANIDKITGLLNRDTLEKRIIAEINKKESDKSQIIFLVDLDNFKIINDTLGHQVGDKVITCVGDRLSKIFNDNYIVGRLGGDEFMIFFKGEQSEESICILAQKIINELSIECGDMIVSTSVGIFFDRLGKYDFNELYSFADKALYKVKNNSKGTYKLLVG